MSTDQLHMHFVSTLKDAAKMIKKNKYFWVSNCGCRERAGECKQSRMDVCLMFNDIEASGTGKREITQKEALAILSEAESKMLVARPFRNEDKSKVNGICFCCNDCCNYFLDPSEPCDKGEYIEKTSLISCTNCGNCVDVCHFHAREIANDKLKLTRKNCYGCGLCVSVCPEDCIQMIHRSES